MLIFIINNASFFLFLLFLHILTVIRSYLRTLTWVKSSNKWNIHRRVILVYSTVIFNDTFLNIFVDFACKTEKRFHKSTLFHHTMPIFKIFHKSFSMNIVRIRQFTSHRTMSNHLYYFLNFFKLYLRWRMTQSIYDHPLTYQKISTYFHWRRKNNVCH